MRWPQQVNLITTEGKPVTPEKPVDTRIDLEQLCHRSALPN